MRGLGHAVDRRRTGTAHTHTRSIFSISIDLSLSSLLHLYFIYGSGNVPASHTLVKGVIPVEKRFSYGITGWAMGDLSSAFHNRIRHSCRLHCKLHILG